jgi:PKD repeat protein
MRPSLAVLACGLVLLVGCGSATSNSTSTSSTVQTPVANAAGPYTGAPGVAVSFNGSNSTDPQGQTLTYAWDFGDSSTGTGASPTHTYATAGYYTAKLTVTDTSNLSNTTGVGVTIAVAPLTSAALTGVVTSGLTPIAAAKVYLLAANTAGYGAISASLLSAAQTGASDSVGAYVTTDRNGNFSLTGEYSCVSGQQLYLYALGGNKSVNASSGLLAAIGSCPASGASAIYATVNEVTTVATAYAIAGFATDAIHVASSGTALAKVGVANAFANAANLATLSTGVALATTPAGNGTVPQTEINTLANILASCVETASCTTLFTTATSDGTITGTVPSETATAAINIAHHPGSNITTLYALATSTDYTPSMSSWLATSDFTMALTFTGGGLSEGYRMAIDGSGNAWVANYSGNSVTKFSNTGTVLSGSSGFTGGGLNNPYGVAIDGSGNAWISNSSGNSITKLSTSGAVLSGTNGYTGGGLSNPSPIAIDGVGNVWAANNTESVTEFSGLGSILSGASGYAAGGGAPYNVGIALDGSGSAWILYGGSPQSIAKILSTGSSFYSGWGRSLSVTGGIDVGAIAIDSAGNAWVPYRYGVMKIATGGYILGSYSALVPNYPTGIAIDGSGNVWVASNGNGIIECSSGGLILSVVGPGFSGFASGTVLGSSGGLAVDGSGDVWVSTGNGSGVAELLGIATPVITPIVAGLPATPTTDGSSNLGTRP